MFPVFLNLHDRHCLVVGGGAVGQRKANALVEAGANVLAICLEPEPATIPTGLTWRTEAYRPDHLIGMSLTFAAATSDVNAQVVADARSRGIWVNSATDPEAGDFVLPAVAHKGRIQVAVGTGGTSPALAARIRDLLAGQIDEGLIAWVDLVAELRAEIVVGVPRERRGPLLRRLAEPEWLARIRTEGPDAVRQALRAVVERELGR